MDITEFKKEHDREQEKQRKKADDKKFLFG